MRKSGDLGKPGVGGAAAAEQARTTPAAASGGLEELRVLVVDDHAPVLRFLSFAFASNGCLVTTAPTAEEALELIAEQTYDLVVSDIKMPGLSGLDVLQAVKGKQPGTPVVLITGQPSVDTAVFGLRHQAYDYLPKPFSTDEVRQLIERVRQDRKSRDESASAPTHLTKELARRQFGIEVLSRLGELALEGLETSVFLDRALEYINTSLTGDAAVILLRDDEGNFTASQKGDASVAGQLASLGRGWFDTLHKSAEKDAVSSPAGPEQSFAALAVVIPGVGTPVGILCLGRDQGREFLADEKELLPSYARTIAVSLQKILLGENLEGNLIDTISSFVIALESKDVYLKGHSARVSLYAGEIAKALGLAAPQVALARRVGILHDLGKLVVMDSILQKPGRLTNEELVQMRGHPLSAAKILRPLRFLAQEADAIKRHHERFDGKGYPDGLAGEDIPLPARIVTVADSFDAMTSKRPYRSAIPLEKAVEEILSHAGAQFDPVVTEAFARIPLDRLSEINRFYDNERDSMPDTPAPAAPAAAASYGRTR